MMKKSLPITLSVILVLSIAAISFAADPYIDNVVSAGTYGAPVSLDSGPGTAETLVTSAPDSPPASNFIQLSSGSEIVMEFVDNLAYPSGDSNYDLRLWTYDTIYYAYADVFVSENGTSWTFVGNYADTPVDQKVNIDIDAYGVTFPVKFVKLVETSEDPAYPMLGFDLDAVEALYLEPQIPIPPAELGCTYTQGYWKNHNWPVSESGWFSDETLWNAPKKGNAWDILAHQYIAASLNEDNSAYVPANVSDAMGDALFILENDADHIIKAGDTTYNEAIELAGILAAYNEGTLGVPHCE